MTFYYELSQAFYELYGDITSLCMKNKVLKLKISSLTKNWDIEDNDGKYKMKE